MILQKCLKVLNLHIQKAGKLLGITYVHNI